MRGQYTIINRGQASCQTSVQLRNETQHLLNSFSSLRIRDLTALENIFQNEVSTKYPRILSLELGRDFCSALCHRVDDLQDGPFLTLWLAYMFPRLERLVLLRDTAEKEEQEDTMVACLDVFCYNPDMEIVFR